MLTKKIGIDHMMREEASYLIIAATYQADIATRSPKEHCLSKITLSNFRSLCPLLSIIKVRSI